MCPVRCVATPMCPGRTTARTRDLLLDGMIVRQPTVTDSNLAAPIATLSALTHRQKLLFHPFCTRISEDVPVGCYNPTSVFILHSGPLWRAAKCPKPRRAGAARTCAAAERTFLAWMRTRPGSDGIWFCCASLRPFLATTAGDRSTARSHAATQTRLGWLSPHCG